MRHAQATHVKSAWVQVYSRRHSILQRQLRYFNLQTRDVDADRTVAPISQYLQVILSTQPLYLSCTLVSIQTAYTQHCTVIQSLHQRCHDEMHTSVTLLTYIPRSHFSRKYKTFVFSVNAETTVMIWKLKYTSTCHARQNVTPLCDYRSPINKNCSSDLCPHAL